MISLFSTNSIFLILFAGGRVAPVNYLRQRRRVDQKLTRSDGPAAAYSGRHDCNLSRVAVEEALQHATVAVVVGWLAASRSMSQSSPIGAWRFRLAAFNFLNHGKQLCSNVAAVQRKVCRLSVSLGSEAEAGRRLSERRCDKLGRRLLECQHNLASDSSIPRRLCRKAFAGCTFKDGGAYLCALKSPLMLDSLQAPLTKAHGSVGRFVNAA